MRRALPALLLLCLAASAARAESRRVPVDADAIREAIRGSSEREGYASSRAYGHYLEARLAEDRGDLDAARKELESAIVYDDRSPELRLALAWAHARADELDRATEQLDRVLQAAPGDPDALLLLGKIRAAQHRRREAVDALEKSVAARPGEPEAWLMLVRLHADFGEFDRAEKIAARFAKAHPSSGAAWRLLARLSGDRRRPAAARQYLRRAAALEPDHVPALLQLADLEERLGDPAEAVRIYGQVLALEPTEGQALLGAARLALRTGDEAGARAYFQQLLGTARDPIRAALLVVGAWRQTHRPQEALAVLDAASEAGDPRLAFARGVLLASMGRCGEAVAALDSIPPETGPLQVAASARKADCLSLAGRHTEAIEALRSGLEHLRGGGGDPEDLVAVVPDIYRRAGRSGDGVEALLPVAGAHPGDAAVAVALARTLQDAGRTDQALALLAAELVQAPGDERLLFALASARERAGDVEGAIALVEALLRGNPDNASALNFVGYLWADRGERLDEARKHLERALELRPDEPYFLDSLGWCEVKRGNFARAVELLERARELVPDEAVVQHHLAEAYVGVGRRGEALASWTRALELLDRDPDPRVRAEVERALGAARGRAAR